MKKFVVEYLQKRLTSYMLIQKQMASSLTCLKNSVVQALAKEIAEFNEDKKDVAETKVRLVREANPISKLRRTLSEKRLQKYYNSRKYTKGEMSS